MQRPFSRLQIYLGVTKNSQFRLRVDGKQTSNGQFATCVVANTKSRNGQYRLRVDQAQCNDHLADYKSIWASQKIVSSDCVLMANKRVMVSSQPALLQIQKAEMDSTDCVLIRHNATTI
jgi:hypothetical protein